MCFVWILEKTAIIFLYSTIWQDFITETGCVHCAVRIEFFNMVPVNLGLYMLRRSVAGLSPRRAGFDPRPVWDLWRTKWKWKRLFAQDFDFPPPVPLHQCSVLIFILTLLVPEGQVSKAWKPSNKGALFRKPGSTQHKRTES
jgi:hypothetical protein